MSKAVPIAIVAVLGAAAGLPPVVGMFTQSQVAARVAALDAHPVLAARVAEYERGWASSAARIELAIDESYAAQMVAAAPDAPPVDVSDLAAPVVVDIAHGPIAIGRGVHLGWSSFVARLDPEHDEIAALLARLDVPYLFEFRGRTSFGGTLDFDADMPPIALDEPDGELAFSGATLEGSLAGRDLRWELEAQSFRTTEGGGRFLAERIGGRGELELLSPYMAVGTATFDVAGIQAAGPFGEPLVEVVDLGVDGGWELDSTGELLTGHVLYRVGSLAAADVELADARVGVRMSNLDVEAVQEYQELMIAANPADLEAALAARIEPVVERILARSPQLAIEPISFRWGNEPFDGDVLLEIDAAALPPRGALDLDDPLPLIGALRARANATMSKVLTQDLAKQIVSMQLSMMGGPGGAMPPDQIDYMAGAQAGLMIVSLLGQGYLVDDGDRYSTSIELGNRTLTVNGNPLPLP